MSNIRAKILVVDDDPVIRDMTCQILEPAGFETICADSGGEGLRLARESKPDLVLLDVNMPDLSGLDVCRQIKSDPELRDIFVVLFSSSQTDSDSQSGGLESGADGYITRPIANRELIARLQAMLRIHDAEDAARKSLERWQATFDAVGDVIFLTDADFNILNCNRATAQVFHLSTAEIIGKKCYEVIHCTDSPALGCRFQRVKENIRRETFVFEHDGHWLEVNMDPTLDTGGAFAGTVHVIKDITERKRDETRLRRSEEVLAQAGMVAHLGAWEIEANGAEDINASPLLWSDEIYRIFGYEPGSVDVTNQLFFEHVHPDDRKAVVEAISQAIEKKQPYEIEHRIIRKDGVERIVLEHAEITFDEAGQPTRILGAVQDITERKRDEEAMTRRQAFERLLTSIQSDLLAADPEELDGAIIRAQRQLCEFLGTDRSALWQGTAEEPQRLGLTHLCALDKIPPVPVDITVNKLFPWVTQQLLQKQMVIIADVKSLPPEATTDRENLLHYGDRGTLALPFTIGEPPVFGALSFTATTHPAVWTDVLLSQGEFIAQIFSGVLARKSVEKARNQAEAELKKRASQLALINKVGQQIAGVLAIQGVLELAARLVNETFGYYHVALFTFDEQQGLVMRTRAGQFSNFFPENHRIPLGEGMVGNVGHSGRMILSNDVQHERSYRNYFPQLLPTASELSLPIKIGDKILGVLDVQSPYRNAFNDNDITVLEIVADQVAVALENARLYETIWKELLERKKIENELVQHRDHLEELVKARTTEVQDLYDNAPCGYHSLDANGNFVMINQTELNWLGYTREEMIGRSEMDFLSEQSAAMFHATFPTFKETGWSRDIELEFVRKDGSTMPILLSATAIYDPAGNFVMSRSTVFDNTKRKQAEKSLRESEEQNRLLFEETPEAISLLTMSGEFVRANYAFEQLTRIPLSQVIGKTARLLGLVTAEEYTHLRAAFAKSRDEHESFATVEHMLLCGDGNQRSIESRIFRLKIGGDDRILVVSRDISAQKETEEALRRANKEMVQAMHLKDEFLASMSHELRTPLTGILGLSEALQLSTYGELTEKQLKALKNIENSGRHLLELINDILDLSKIEAGKLEMQFEPCSLGDICQASLQMTKGMAHQKHQAVSFSMTPASIGIRADSRRLKQMLVNLLSNAVKFTPEHGSLGLDVQASQADHVVRISVWDKGIGIAPEDMKRLFKPFVQLDSRLARQHSGTGLGLSLVQRMAELHGGSVQMESTLGEGSRFTIVLPWSSEGTQPIVPPRRNTGSLRTSLTIEDSEIDAEQLTRYLRQLDITNIVHPFRKGAVDLAARLNPGVILLDLKLPDAAGLELLAALKADERTRHIPVIICSVQDNRADAMTQGAAGYLVKPFTLAELRDMLGRIAYQQNAFLELASKPLPKGPLVLIADDNQITIQIISDFLGIKHFRVEAASNGADLLDMAEKIHPDIILMDIQMPGMDGLEASRRVRAHTDPLVAKVPIIALTALAMPGDREMCLQAGANEYMSKPLQLQKLFETIQKMTEENANGRDQ